MWYVFAMIIIIKMILQKYGNAITHNANKFVIMKTAAPVGVVICVLCARRVLCVYIRTAHSHCVTLCACASSIFHRVCVCVCVCSTTYEYDDVSLYHSRFRLFFPFLPTSTLARYSNSSNSMPTPQVFRMTFTFCGVSWRQLIHLKQENM